MLALISSSRLKNGEKMFDFIFQGSVVRTFVATILLGLLIGIPLRYCCGPLTINEVHYDDSDRLILFYSVQ